MAVKPLQISALVLTATAAFGQSFEVVSIKPSAPDAQGSSISRNPHGRFSTKNVTLRALIGMAWSVREFQVEVAPKWFDSDGFDIAAVPANYSENGQRTVGGAEMNTMIRGLLADRFKLAAHRETKEGPVYFLVVGKAGSKMHELPPDVANNGVMTGHGKIRGNRVLMSVLAKTLSSQLSRTVIDKTGLTGEYDVNLEWNPDLTAPENGIAPEGPSIFTAVQEQLGLKLEPGKGPVEVLVIDHAEKPTEN